MAASGSATQILAMAEPATAAAGTYSIQMTECQSCLKNATTISTMLAVMQQQAQTLKEQQGTIANLITMLSNATGNGMSNMSSQRPETSSRLTQLMKTPTARSKGPSQPQSQKSTATKASMNRSVYSPGSPVPRNPRGRPPKANYTPKAVSVSKSKKRAVDNDFLPSEDEVDSDARSPAGHDDGHDTNNNNNNNNNNEADDDTVTKIWIRGTASEKCPCPLAECANRKFAAADMYYLRRHFQQVHGASHPNPYFVIQCPVDDCGAEFEQSLREMRKHLTKEHNDLYPPSGRKNKDGANVTAAQEGETENGGENGDGDEEAAVSEVVSEE